MSDDRLEQPQGGRIRPSSVPPDRVVAVGFAERSPPPPQVEVADGADLPTEESPRDRSIHPPGPTSDRYLGCTIDNRYKVEGIVGEGGMGVVYQCRHKIIDKRVALKILRADLAKDAEVTERFLMEAKAASAIADEHIISISDFGQLPDGAAYFVMEFLDGTPLAQVTGGGVPMPLERILPIARQLSEGLGSAHQRGIVHRDLKPDNVFLIQRGKEVDFVKILDFGIAKVSSTGGGRLTQAGSVFGTPHYMSPEQAAGTPLDQRGDIYSLGVMLYEMATGRVPFDAENFVGILSRHLYEDPVPPRTAAPHVNIPADFEAIILKCMAKKPEHRYQSMLQLRDELWQLERRRGPKLAEPSSTSSIEPSASVEGTALSTELSLASLRPRRWPLYAAIAAPLAVVVGVFAVDFGNVGGRATPGATVVAAGTAPASPGTSLGVPPAPEPSPASLEAPSEPLPVHVLLGVAPPTAHVFLDGRDLGASPVSIDVPAKALVTVEVRHPDYITKQMQLDGSEVRVNVELDSKNKKRGKRSKSRRSGEAGNAKKAAPASKSPTARGRSEEPIGGQLFVEPWQKP
jgi:eukaryotic-like serine/threonine-protein kinase